MAKRATTFTLALPPGAPLVPAYRWLYESLRGQILGGRLRPGAKLPATRDLANQYGLSRGTIVSAFELLKSEGYLEGVIGSGTYVSRVLPDALLQVKRAAGLSPARQPRKSLRISAYGRRLQLFSALEERPSRAFRSNLPALDLFPTTLWAQLAARRMRRSSVQLLLGCESMGYKPLRKAVADYLGSSRGVRCAPEQIAILSGTQEALDLTSRLFVNPGDRVCMENPGYVGACLVFKAQGAKIVHTGLDEQGMKIPGPGSHRSRLVYLTPGHQFPMGITMSLARRLEILEWAEKSGTLIFEDDYDSEYRYSGAPIPALQGFDREGCVIFAGSFSKVLFPSLRLGYLVIPEKLVRVYAAGLSLTTRHAPLFEQAVLCDFIAEGHFSRHLRRMREVYAERLAVLVESARDELAGILEISPIEAGLQTIGWLSKGIDAETATRAAADRGVEVFPLGRYGHGRLPREGLQLGFAAVDEREIRRGVHELRKALEMLKPAMGMRPTRKAASCEMRKQPLKASDRPD